LGIGDNINTKRGTLWRGTGVITDNQETERDDSHHEMALKLSQNAKSVPKDICRKRKCGV